MSSHHKGKQAEQPALEARPATAPGSPATTESPPAATLNLPFLSARVAIPGQGIDMKAGPVRLSLPTRYLYYGGLGALTVAGAIEWPIAGALAVTGLIVDRLRTPAADRPQAVGAGAGAGGK